MIKELAGHPCIILGRCASEILKDQPNVFNIYVSADKEDRIHRIMKKNRCPMRRLRPCLRKTTGNGPTITMKIPARSGAM